MLPKEYYANTYDTPTVIELCQLAGIETPDVPHIAQELEHFAAIYRWETAKTESRTPVKVARRELEAVANQTARLMDTLANLSPKAAAVIEHQADLDSQDGMLSNPASPGGASLFVRLDDFGDDIVGHAIDLEMLHSILGGLHRAADTRDGSSHMGHSRKPQDFGLLLWLSNIRQFWHAQTDLPFSRDVAPDGEPITAAGLFCLTAFQKIDPDCHPSRVMNGMKALITRQNKSTGKMRA